MGWAQAREGPSRPPKPLSQDRPRVEEGSLSPGVGRGRGLEEVPLGEVMPESGGCGLGRRRLWRLGVEGRVPAGQDVLISPAPDVGRVASGPAEPLVGCPRAGAAAPGLAP